MGAGVGSEGPGVGAAEGVVAVAEGAQLEELGGWGGVADGAWAEVSRAVPLGCWGRCDRGRCGRGWRWCR